MTLKNINQYICFAFHSIIYRLRIKPRWHFDVVIVRSDAIGDFVMWMSAVPYYREKYQGKSILLICPTSDYLLAEATGCFDDIFTFDRMAVEEKVWYNVKYMLTMKRIYADTVINPTWQHQMSADYICAMINATNKIETLVQRQGLREKWCDKYFTNLVEMPDLKTASEFEAIECFTQKVISPDFRYLLTDMSKIVDGKIASISVPYCCISLSASIERKNWPIDRVSQIMKSIPEKFCIVLMGYGKEDMEKSSYLIIQDEGRHIIYNYVNKTSVLDMLKIISGSTFVLGNDSVAIHMAAACRVRSICYTHGAHFKRFVPYPDFIPEKLYHPRCVFKKMDCYGCNYRCKYDSTHDKPLYCLRMVTADMVIAKLQELITEITN